MRFSSQTGNSKKIGQWSSHPKLSSSDDDDSKNLKDDDNDEVEVMDDDEGPDIGGLSMLNKTLEKENDTEIVTLAVVTKEELPYVILRRDKTGNDAFDGFAIDLLKVRNFNPS